MIIGFLNSWKKAYIDEPINYVYIQEGKRQPTLKGKLA